MGKGGRKAVLGGMGEGHEKKAGVEGLERVRWPLLLLVMLISAGGGSEEGGYAVAGATVLRSPPCCPCI